MNQYFVDIISCIIFCFQTFTLHSSFRLPQNQRLFFNFHLFCKLFSLSSHHQFFFNSVVSFLNNVFYVVFFGLISYCFLIFSYLFFLMDTFSFFFLFNFLWSTFSFICLYFFFTNSFYLGFSLVDFSFLVIYWQI